MAVARCPAFLYAPDRLKPLKPPANSIKIETPECVCEIQSLNRLEIQHSYRKKNTKNFDKTSCIISPNRIYYKSLCKAMRWEVTLL